MELDELKILFKEAVNENAAIKSAQELTVLLGRRTTNILDKIKRSLVIELTACVIFTISLIIAAILVEYSSVKIYCYVFSLLCVIFIPVLWLLLRQVNSLRQAALPVKANLEQITRLLSRYSKVYFQLTMAIVPIAVVFSFWLGFNDNALMPYHAANNTVIFDSSMYVYILIMVIYAGALMAGMYFFTRWYLRKLYGNYINQLKDLVKELDN